ncbi:MAG TPA: NAD(P)H-hydrate dehydratase [Kiritimatiellia bacterium]|nr:NAD(P)H-hydrate dehydratase [Kiritimatiellia bacterium]
MIFVTAESMREIDRRTIEDYSVSGEHLMDRAGASVADLIRRVCESSGMFRPRVLFLAGRGNNGGDAFVAARYLKEDGYDVEVWLAGLINQVQGDALLHMSRLNQAGVEVTELSTMDDWLDVIDHPWDADVLVDGLLGTGLSGPVRGPLAGAIQYINQAAKEAFCISIDLPSGLNGDTGRPSGDVVRADVTATIGLPKAGFTHPGAVDYLGTVEVLDIGFPLEVTGDAVPANRFRMLVPGELSRLVPYRAKSSHKGSFGHVVVVAGSRRYCGAATLAGAAALRSGAGLVTVVAPACLHGVIASQWPELMVVAGREDEEGRLIPEGLEDVEGLLGEASAVVVGPGLGEGAGVGAVVRGVLRASKAAVILDASALQVVAEDPSVLSLVEGRTVMTPHPGEMARLLGLSAAEVQKDREGAVRRLAEMSGGVVVLKGAGTLIAEPGREEVAISLFANPGLATAGTGDVLAGMIGGWLGQGVARFDGACLAVYLHGRAGELASYRRSQIGMVAGDVLEDVSTALRDVTLR